MNHLLTAAFLLVGAMLPSLAGPGVHREVCIDRLEFNPDGTIKPVVPTK